MSKFIVRAANRITGEIKDFDCKITASASNSDGIKTYIHMYCCYSDMWGDHKDDIVVYPEFKLVTVLTSTKFGTEYTPDTIVPDMYDLINIYQSII